MKTYTVTVEEDPEHPGEMLLPIPEELMEEMGWEVGDALIFEVVGDKISIRKLTCP